MSVPKEEEPQKYRTPDVRTSSVSDVCPSKGIGELNLFDIEKGG
jgi:hypothetical protein